MKDASAPRSCRLPHHPCPRWLSGAFKRSSCAWMIVSASGVSKGARKVGAIEPAANDSYISIKASSGRSGIGQVRMEEALPSTSQHQLISSPEPKREAFISGRVRSCNARHSARLKPHSRKKRERGVETPSNAPRSQILRPGGMRVCPAGLPVKAHALCALPGFPTSGFGRRPERT